MMGSAYTPHGFHRADCATETMRSGCIIQGFVEDATLANRTVGMYYAGVSESITCNGNRWLGCIIHEFCGAVQGSDDLEMIWR